MAKKEILADWENLVKQIDAIQAGDLALYSKLAKIDDISWSAAGRSAAHAAWVRSGNSKKLSLFRFLPGCGHCLTTAKSTLVRGTAGKNLRAWNKKLGLMSDPLIPSVVLLSWNPSLSVLYEFAGLQLIATYGEAACRKAGVLED